MAAPATTLALWDRRSMASIDTRRMSDYDRRRISRLTALPMYEPPLPPPPPPPPPPVSEIRSSKALDIPSYRQSYTSRQTHSFQQSQSYSFQQSHVPSWMIQDNPSTQQLFDRPWSLQDLSEWGTYSAQPTHLPDSDNHPQRQPNRWTLTILMIALCLAVFCMALDNTIIAAAIPRITDQFDSLDDTAWYISAYLLTTCSFQLFFGRLYTFFSIKLIFLLAIFLFEAGSLMCGAAPSSVILIIGRAVAGLGSAGIFSGGILIIAHSVPLAKRPIYVGILASMYGIASVAGPLMGGAFTDHLSWRWCFYINLPIGAITILVIIFFFKNPESHNTTTRLTGKEKLAKLDPLGTLLFIPAVVAMVLALQWGGLLYKWSDPLILILLVGFGVLVLAFIINQFQQQDNGTVPPRIMKNRSVAGASWWAFMFGGSFFICLYYIPIYFQIVLGVTPLQSGIDSLPLVLSCSVFCGIAGAGITLFGYFTPFLIAASVIMTIGAGLITTFSPGMTTATWVGYQFLAGSGYGLGIQIPLIVVQAILPLEDVPTGTAIIMFSQTLGGAIFTPVAQNVFLSVLSKEIVSIWPGVSAQQLYTAGGATTIRTVLSGETLTRVLSAFSGSLDAAFVVSTVLAGLSIFGALAIEWRSVKGQLIIGAG